MKKDMRFGTCNVRSVYRAGSLTAVTMELARYKLDLVSLQEDKWDERGTVRARECIFLWKRKRKSSVGNRIFVHHRIE
jgi:hypothetical protein